MSFASRMVPLQGQRPLWTPALATVAPLALFEAGWGITADASTGAVSAWLSRYGTPSASQATGASQPIWSATGRNGCPTLTFDGTDDYLTVANISSFPTGGNATTMIVMGTNTGLSKSLFGYGSGGAGADRRVQTSGTPPTTFVSVGIQGTTYQSTTLWAGYDRLVSWRFSTSTSILNIDGAADEAAATGTPATVITRCRIGANVSLTASSFWNGTSPLALLYGVALADDDRWKNEGWAAWMYGTRAYLAPSHPYAGHPPRASAEEVERFLDTWRDIPFRCELDARRHRKLYLPARRLIVPGFAPERIAA